LVLEIYVCYLEFAAYLVFRLSETFFLSDSFNTPAMVVYSILSSV